MQDLCLLAMPVGRPLRQPQKPWSRLTIGLSNFTCFHPVLWPAPPECQERCNGQHQAAYHQRSNHVQYLPCASEVVAGSKSYPGYQMEYGSALCKALKVEKRESSEQICSSASPSQARESSWTPAEYLQRNRLTRSALHMLHFATLCNHGSPMQS